MELGVNARRLRVGITGTFDVQNYGDLLFPLIAEAELSRRLGPIDLSPFSYHARRVPHWPYDVTPLSRLPTIVDDLDGLIVGGGLLVRFDKDVAPGYVSPAADVHHPTGYWLVPALLALQAGRPVVWNAPSAAGPVPDWAKPLMRLAIGSSRYVAMRDDVSRSALLGFAGETEIAVVPDTGFGIARLLEHVDRSPAFSGLCEQLGLRGPYIVVHATTGLQPFCELVRDHPERFADFQIVALPTGPALGDGAGHIRADLPNVIDLPAWPNPILIAEIIKHATAVVGKGLHLSVTALGFGVPVFRPAHAFGGKYAILSDFSSVHAFADSERIEPSWFLDKVGRRDVEPGVVAANLQLSHHWDTIASIIESGTSRRVPQEVGRIWQRLPIVLETGFDRAQSVATLEGDIASLRADIVGLDDRVAAQSIALAESNRRLEEKQAVVDELNREIGVITMRLRAAEEARNAAPPAPAGRSQTEAAAASAGGHDQTRLRRRGRLRRLIKWPTFRTAKRLLKRAFRERRERWIVAQSGLFDPTWYLSNYPDVATAGVDPVEHYLTAGAAEGRDPGPSFSTSKYLSLRPEVAAAGLNPLLHFIAARRGGDAAFDMEEIRPGPPDDLAGSAVGRLLHSFSDRSNEDRAVVYGPAVSGWHQNGPRR
ncbi:polysaccharide pyruvyl transferase family protein [Rhodoplanes roseus]|uniref:Polysaccharide pyruvyl transferase domain-containing protein n=1 Tax=Rhodoplanes roseus TaxID=29409 RepID=A0A327KYA6_9BRAD|nr:polysaccharide pyruvyl transferase family protein [Rhodoplanes roseus]RAI43870.1 hypothetical protein CH341_12130 [Rhodoplanes roseus]